MGEMGHGPPQELVGNCRGLVSRGHDLEGEARPFG